MLSDGQVYIEIVDGEAKLLAAYARLGSCSHLQYITMTAPNCALGFACMFDVIHFLTHDPRAGGTSGHESLTAQKDSTEEQATDSRPEVEEVESCNWIEDKVFEQSASQIAALVDKEDESHSPTSRRRYVCAIVRSACATGRRSCAGHAMFVFKVFVRAADFVLQFRPCVALHRYFTMHMGIVCGTALIV